MFTGRLPELELHQPQDVTRTTDKEDLHDRVVRGYPGTGEEVDIACQEDGQVESLGLERDACVSTRDTRGKRSANLGMYSIQAFRAAPRHDLDV